MNGQTDDEGAIETTRKVGTPPGSPATLERTVSPTLAGGGLATIVAWDETAGAVRAAMTRAKRRPTWCGYS